MPVLTLVAEKKPAIAPIVGPVVRAARTRVVVPTWAVLAIVLLAAISGYAAGRKKPAHYAPYFGNMVVDTNTGKACYLSQPKSDEGNRDAAYPIEGTVNRTDSEPVSGPRIPLCGQE